MQALDGHTRLASIREIEPGMVLRDVQSDGSIPPFSDMVVTKVYTTLGTPMFDASRPYAVGAANGELMSVERLTGLTDHQLGHFQLVLTASGKPCKLTAGW